MMQRPLFDLAVVYLAMAQSTGDRPGNAELDAVTDNLHARYAGLSRADVQDVVLEALGLYLQQEDWPRGVLASVRALKEDLSYAQKAAVLKDLRRIARADGVVLRSERGLLQTLADVWGIRLSHDMVAQPLHVDVADVTAWGVLHDLALIYLILAHGADSDLSGAEVSVILNKLQEWRPALGEKQVQAILDQAMERYAEGPGDAALGASAAAVKGLLPKAQRMAALHDLIQIANADGVFLDEEEDLINELVSAWEVDPYATYGAHGSKA